MEPFKVPGFVLDSLKLSSFLDFLNPIVLYELLFIIFIINFICIKSLKLL